MLVRTKPRGAAGVFQALPTNRLLEKEAALLVPVFLLRTGLLLAEVVDELSRDDLEVCCGRASQVWTWTVRGVGAPPLMKKVERVAF